MTLEPPPLAHARLDLGWVAHERLGMWSIEVVNPVTSDLLGAKVQPLRAYQNVVEFLISATAAQREAMLELLDPAPFG